MGKRVRNAPSAMNLCCNGIFFGMAGQNIEAQALEPIKNPLEMDLPIEDAILRLRNHKLYRDYFQENFQ